MSNRLLKSRFHAFYIAGIEQPLSYDTKPSIEIYHREPAILFDDPNSSNLLLNTGSGYAQGIEFTIKRNSQKDFSGVLQTLI
jgi:hypothetical protein